MTWWEKLGAFDDTFENLGPFALWWRNDQAKWPDEENGKLGPWWRNGTLNPGQFDDAMGKILEISKLETLAMMKLGPLDDLMGKVEALDH